MLCESCQFILSPHGSGRVVLHALYLNGKIFSSDIPDRDQQDRDEILVLIYRSVRAYS
jgi:hypothetical protein